MLIYLFAFGPQFIESLGQVPAYWSPILVKDSDIDEKGIRREKPEDLVMALAEAKVWIPRFPIIIYFNYVDTNLTITSSWDAVG